MYAPERLGALTDGVFAIALTLLVLELKLPDPPPSSNLTLSEIVGTDWHPFLGWVISFIVLSRLWLIQHDTAAALTRASSRTLMINMVFLGTISLIPFAANLISVSDLDQPLSLQMFAILVGINALVLGWFVRSAEQDQALVEGRSPRWSHRALHHLIGVPVVSAIAVAVTVIDPAWTVLVWGIESVVVVAILLSSGRGDDPARKTPATI